MPPAAAAEPGDQPLELGRYGRALRRNWLLMVLIVFPLLFGYTVYAYRVFRGKVSRGMYEHQK